MRKEPLFQYFGLNRLNLVKKIESIKKLEVNPESSFVMFEGGISWNWIEGPFFSDTDFYSFLI